MESRTATKQTQNGHICGVSERTSEHTQQLQLCTRGTATHGDAANFHTGPDILAAKHRSSFSPIIPMP
jgi:hypothetical protein